MGEFKKYMAGKIKLEKSIVDDAKVPIFICNHFWKWESMEKWDTFAPETWENALEKVRELG